METDYSGNVATVIIVFFLLVATLFSDSDEQSEDEDTSINRPPEVITDKSIRWGTRYPSKGYVWALEKPLFFSDYFVNILDVMWVEKKYLPQDKQYNSDLKPLLIILDMAKKSNDPDYLSLQISFAEEDRRPSLALGKEPSKPYRDKSLEKYLEEHTTILNNPETFHRQKGTHQRLLVVWAHHWGVARQRFIYSLYLRFPGHRQCRFKIYWKDTLKGIDDY
ncbi:hypothetical protein ACFL35_01620 [Candidatus Riflebacteria bacterium]